MKFKETSELYSLNKSTYIKLRWIAYFGQLTAVLFVEFVLKFNFDYLICIFVIFFSALTNLYLELGIKENQLNNTLSSLFLSFDIIQLGILFYLTGGITNPFIFLIIVPAIFASQQLTLKSSILLGFVIILSLIILSFFHLELPHPDDHDFHFHTPNYFLYAIPISIIIGLIFLVYFGIKFGEESRIRKKAFDKIQEIMAKENELLSLGGQAAAAAHSLGTPLSTIMLTAKELQKEFTNDDKLKKDLDLLVSQSNRCSEILKKLTLNPNIDDDFVTSNITLREYLNEIIRSFKEISKKEFIIDDQNFQNQIKVKKSTEVLYGLRNFIGNANKFSKNKIEIFLSSNENITKILIRDDGPGFPKDLIYKHILGEPYIRSADKKNISKYGLGLGTFIGKTLLEKKYADITFSNSNVTNGAEVLIEWSNKNLEKI